MARVTTGAVRDSNKLPDNYVYEELKAVVPLSGEWVRAGHNTLVRWNEDHIELTLHGGTIARLFKDRVQLFTNGWHTPTTADRLDRVLEPYGWEAYEQNGSVWITNSGVPIRVFEGIYVARDGATD